MKTPVCTVALAGLQDTCEFCGAFARKLQLGDVVLLSGEMAVGKTTFVKEMVRALGSVDEASSPTYAIGQFYRTYNGTSLLHIDTYRLRSAAEFIDTSLQDYFDRALVFVEWGELLEDVVATYWQLYLSHVPSSAARRLVRLEAKGGIAPDRVDEMVAAVGRWIGDV